MFNCLKGWTLKKSQVFEKTSDKAYVKHSNLTQTYNNNSKNLPEKRHA